MERGVYVGAILAGLARERGFNQAQLELATGISHSTMSGYWSGGKRLGLKNGRRIAAALGVSISELGLTDPSDQDTDPLIAQAAALLRELERRLGPQSNDPDEAAGSTKP